jgi:hypothetical protein
MTIPNIKFSNLPAEDLRLLLSLFDHFGMINQLNKISVLSVLDVSRVAMQVGESHVST